MKIILKTYVPFIAIGLLLACFEFSPEAQAVVPPPDGGYPGGNTAEGQNALQSLTIGGYNAAIGWLSLRSLTTGSFNTATGAGTLLSNTGNENTATGAGALLSNTTGANNSAIGGFALLSSVGASRNTAMGSRALFAHTLGDYNNAVGAFALGSDTEGEANNAVGDEALFNTTGSGNTAMGDSALHANAIGSQNTAIGKNALSNNTAGSDITALGASAGEGVTNADHVICIGHSGANVSNSCFIGHIYGAMIDPGTAVNAGIDASGKLGTTSPSRRFKCDIQPMKKVSDAILALKPVSFHYKSDAKNTPCFGLIAEEVEKVNADLMVRDKEGKPYSVRYDQVNAMLLNEFLKEHNKVEKLESTVANLVATTKEQASQIQKVSADLESTKRTQQVVLNR